MMQKVKEYFNAILNQQFFQSTLFWGTLFFIINMIIKGLYAGTYSMWIDEAHQVSMATYGLGGIWELHTNAANGPFYTWLLSLWIDIFGISEFATRMLSVLFASLAAFSLFAFAKKYYNFITAFISTLLFTFGNTIIYYSHEARSYTLILLLVILSFHYTIKVIENYKKRNLIIYFLLITALLYTHLTMVLVVAMQFYIALIYFVKNKKAFWSLFIAQFASGVMISLWVLSNNWFGGNETTWGHVPNFPDLLQMIQRYLNWVQSRTLWLLLFVIVLIIILGSVRSKLINQINYRKLQIAVVWALFPIFAMYFISIYYNPRFVPRYMLFAAPGIYLLIGYVLSLPKIRNLILFVVLLLVSFTYVKKVKMSPAKSEEWRELVSEYKKLKDENSNTFISASYMHWPFSYYYDKEVFKDDLSIKRELAKDDIYFVNTFGGVKKTKSKNKRYDIIILAHNNVVDPNKTILNYYMDNKKLIEIHEFKSIILYKFDNSSVVDSAGVQCFDFETDAIKHKTIKISDKAKSGNHVALLTEKDKYGATYQNTMQNFYNSKVKLIDVSAFLMPLSKVNDIRMVIDISNADGKNLKYESVSVNKDLQIDQWHQIEKRVILPSNYTKDDVIKIYFWNPAGDKFMVDDLCISY